MPVRSMICAARVIAGVEQARAHGASRRTHRPDRPGPLAGRERACCRVRERERAQGHGRSTRPARRWSADSTNGPADLIAGGPDADGGSGQEGQGRRRQRDAVHARRARRVGARGRAKAGHQHGGRLQGDLLAAKSIGYSRGCSGDPRRARGSRSSDHRAGETQGHAHRRRHRSGHDILARGDFELGIQQTNIWSASRVPISSGRCRAGVNKPCPNSVGLLTVSKQQDAARAMIEFMTSPDGHVAAAEGAYGAGPQGS